MVCQVLGTDELLPIILDRMMISAPEVSSDFLRTFYEPEYPTWGFLDHGYSYNRRSAETIWEWLSKAFPKHQSRPNLLEGNVLSGPVVISLLQRRRHEFTAKHGVSYEELCSIHRETVFLS